MELTTTIDQESTWKILFIINTNENFKIWMANYAAMKYKAAVPQVTRCFQRLLQVILTGLGAREMGRHKHWSYTVV